jgi:hypothetical protein
VDHLLPVLAPLPRRWGLVLLALGVTAWLLLVPANARPGTFPGDPDLPYAPVTLNLHWQLHGRGLAGLVADDLHGFPLRTDRVVTDGVPLDAFTSWPLTSAFGFATGMWAWLLLTVWAAGAAGAWLGMRWWGTLGAGLVTGVGFQVGEALLREIADGRPSQAFAALFLPLALGLGVDAARRGSVRAAAGAGVAVGLGTLASWGMGPCLVVVGFGPLVAVALARGGTGVVARVRRTGMAAIGAVGTAGGGGFGAHPETPGDAAGSRGGPVAPGADAGGGGASGGIAGRGAGHGPDGIALVAVLLVAVAALLVPVAPALAWVAAGRGELPSLGMDPWQEALVGLQQVRPVDLALERLWALDGVAVRSLARPALLLAAAWTLGRGRLRHVAAPLAVTCVLALLGLGAWLPGPVVAPWGWLQTLPVLGRLWWPDRNWIGVALGLALLAGGAPRRIAPGLALALFAEAWLLSPSLPFGAVQLGRSPSAQVLAQAPDVPLVLLPTGEGPFRPDRLDLVDQITHGRPMANGTRAALDLTAPDAVLRGWRNNSGLRALLACEMGAGAVGDATDRAEATEALVRAGLREVYLDPRYVKDDTAYVACVEGVLTGWTRGEEAPLVRYRAP